MASTDDSPDALEMAVEAGRFTELRLHIFSLNDSADPINPLLDERLWTPCDFDGFFGRSSGW